MILLGHDKETTGLSPTTEGVVQSCIIVASMDPNGDGEVLFQATDTWNPGKPIHPDAAKVHGISDFEVQDRPGFIEGLTPIYTELFKQHAIVATLGYNNRTFDDRFAHRYGLPRGMPAFDLIKYGRALKTAGKVVNAKLTTVYMYLMKQPIVNAHDAEADVMACFDMLPALMQEFGFSTLEELYEDAIQPKVNKSMTMPYGKHKGVKIKSLPAQYVAWIMNDPDTHERDLIASLQALQEG